MIPGFNEIPEDIRKKNEVFFNNAYFHGDYKYEWDNEDKILTVYCRQGSILGHFANQLVRGAAQAMPYIIKENENNGTEKILYYKLGKGKKFNKLKMEG